jgi:putative Holliday junction resolvase
VVALDLGERRIGVARSDVDQRLSLAHEVLERAGSHRADHHQIAALVDELGAIGVVVGLPLALDGRRGPAAEKVLAEVEELRATLAVPVETIDERLSTAEVLQHRRAALVSRDRARRGGRGGRAGAPAGRAGSRRVVVDDAAAAVILQSWIDAQRREKEER